MERTDLTLAQTVLNAIADSILVCDDGGGVVFANPAARRFFKPYNLSPEGQPLAACLSIFKPEGRRELQNHLRTLQTALPDAAEQPEIILETETQVISVYAAAMPPPTGVRTPWLALVLRDVTRPFQATKSKSDFVSMVSHELRTPMTSIKGYISLLLQGVAGPLHPKQEIFLDIVQRNVDRMTTLINDLLDVSRIEAGKIQ
ncbi:MAG: PAS domain-containing protein, partial [Caldilineae bacterium]